MVVALIVISILLAAFLVVFFVGRAVRRANAPAVSGGEAPIKRKVGVKEWLVTHKPSKRRLIQVYAALLYNANIKGFVTGNIYASETTKYMCVPGLNCYSCPGAVGACPLGAFQNSLAESGTRAPYYILGILALFGLTLARVICGFLCPVGLCQELLYKIRTPKLKKSRVTRVLSYFKYVLLVLAIAIPLIFAVWNVPLPAFCKYICPAGTLGGAVMLLANPNNAGMFAQLGWQFTWKFSLLAVFVVASIFIFRFFCRFFCPLGAIYGFFNKFALIGVDVDKNSCTDCGLCVAHCKMDVKHVGDHECINCGECIAVCPTKAISWKGSKIFLRGSAVAEPGIAVKPLATQNGTVKLSTDIAAVAATDVATAPRADCIAAPETAATENAAAVEPIVNETVAPIGAEAVEPKKKRPVGFWLELAAWVTAAVVLITALICYNFIDVEAADPPSVPPGPTGGDVVIGYNVGETAPDFTVKRYGADGEFNLYSHRGKLTVVNFWATWCTPCVQEIPHFIELAENHPELTVVAVHGSSTRDVAGFIDENGWDGNALLFAQDNLNGTQCLTFRALGGRNAWPLTVIIDADGKVVYNSIKSFATYAELEALVTGLQIN